jgi:quinol monooxygenase YgiN
LLLKDFGIKLPVSSVFAPFCLLAALLTWYAGVSASRIDLSGVRAGRPPGGGRAYAADDRSDIYGGRPNRDYDALDDPSGQGVYRDGGLYRSESRASRPPKPDGRDHGPDWPDRSGPRQGPDGYETGDIDVDYRARDGGYPAERQDRYQGEQDRYQGEQDRYQGEQDRYQGEQDRYQGEQDRYGDDQYEPEYGGGGQEQAYSSGRHSSSRATDRFDEERRTDSRAEEGRGKLFGQIAIYTLLEDRVDEFERLSEQVVAQVRANEPDTLVYILHAVPSAPMQRILYEVYRDRAAYEEHKRQPYVIRFDADRRPYVLATNVIELGLQQAKVSPFPSIEDLFGEPGYDTSGFERPDYLSNYGRSQAPRDEARGGY